MMDGRINPRLIKQQIEEYSKIPSLKKDLEMLPTNYNFEIAKTIWKIKTTNSKLVGLQFPEGLLMYACLITDILRKYTDADVIIMGDVTYGACCVDDFTCKALGCDLLVHYGHSCLVPIQDTPGIHLLYVFVQIDMNLSDCLETIKANFSTDHYLAFVSTIQFVSGLQSLKRALESEGYKIVIPQTSPLSQGEVLGCTSPILPEEVSALIYIGDGRFHLESAMIQNPKVPAYKYDPYSRILTTEQYGFDLMLKTRHDAIRIARNSTNFGLILGTLGRQGNFKLYKHLDEELKKNGKRVVNILLSEIFASKLAVFENVDCWVQVACPRLSIDWGATFSKPLLTAFELSAALSECDEARYPSVYPMDYYSFGTKGRWSNYHESYRAAPTKPKRKHISLQDGLVKPATEPENK